MYPTTLLDEKVAKTPKKYVDTYYISWNTLAILISRPTLNLDNTRRIDLCSYNISVFQKIISWFKNPRDVSLLPKLNGYKPEKRHSMKAWAGVWRSKIIARDACEPIFAWSKQSVIMTRLRSAKNIIYVLKYASNKAASKNKSHFFFLP